MGSQSVRHNWATFTALHSLLFSQLFVRPLRQPFSIFAFLFLGDGFDHCLLYSVTIHCTQSINVACGCYCWLSLIFRFMNCFAVSTLFSPTSPLPPNSLSPTFLGISSKTLFSILRAMMIASPIRTLSLSPWEYSCSFIALGFQPQIM